MKRILFVFFLTPFFASSQNGHLPIRQLELAVGAGYTVRTMANGAQTYVVDSSLKAADTIIYLATKNDVRKGAQNIYNADGSLTENRLLDGNQKRLQFQNLKTVSLAKAPTQTESGYYSEDGSWVIAPATQHFQMGISDKLDSGSQYNYDGLFLKAKTVLNEGSGNPIESRVNEFTFDNENGWKFYNYTNTYPLNTNDNPYGYLQFQGTEYQSYFDSYHQNGQRWSEVFNSADVNSGDVYIGAGDPSGTSSITIAPQSIKLFGIPQTTPRAVGTDRLLKIDDLGQIYTDAGGAGTGEGGGGANSDAQLLSIANNVLSISNGNSIVLPAPPSQNFANTDLIATGSRLHNFSGQNLTLNNIGVFNQKSAVDGKYFTETNNDGHRISVRAANTTFAPYGGAFFSLSGYSAYGATIGYSTGQNDRYAIAGALEFGGVDNAMLRVEGTQKTHAVIVRQDAVRIRPKSYVDTDPYVGTLALYFENLPVYADNAAAAAGGLTLDRVYKTAAGDLKIRY